MLGIITGREITENRDGETKKVMLQIEFLPGDVRTVELMTESGEDANPAIGSRVFVVDETDSYKLAIASTDDLEPACDPGEKEFYSTDDPVTVKKARLKFTKDSESIFNQGVKFAARKDDSVVSTSAEDPAFWAWVTQISAAVNALAPGTVAPVPTSLTGKITDGTNKVLLP